ncbi:uncharacterized protein LOC117340721 [Pecten maximus]|uniref:uncharacterized protein LOC117340721 n=1 Tax=Pecten maximus TaxID=6579 RepID=UPI001458E16C|nr:uncharacterized protein LOC117340721 [Pecten maximus]
MTCGIEEEYHATNINAYLRRTADDFKEPFTSDLPEIRELGLELVSTVKHYTLPPTFDVVNKDTTDKLKYSERIVAMVYPWLHDVFYRGLSDSRSEDEKRMIIDQYFCRIQTYAFEHSDFKPYLFFTEVVMKKKK